MTLRFANNVYDILISTGGARVDERDSFIRYHVDSNDEKKEWRFCGHFGFGGKYRADRNAVDYYAEDDTEERSELVKKINSELFEMTK